MNHLIALVFECTRFVLERHKRTLGILSCLMLIATAESQVVFKKVSLQNYWALYISFQSNFEHDKQNFQLDTLPFGAAYKQLSLNLQADTGINSSRDSKHFVGKNKVVYTYSKLTQSYRLNCPLESVIDSSSSFLSSQNAQEILVRSDKNLVFKFENKREKRSTIFITLDTFLQFSDASLVYQQDQHAYYVLSFLNE